MKKIYSILAVAVLSLGLVSCGAGSSGGSTQTDNVGGTFREADIQLEDGRTVNCLFWNSSTKSNGMSCDWANAR